MGQVLGLEPDRAFELLRALAALLMGAARVEEGPALEDEALPEDVRQFIDGFDPHTTFFNNARRILAGIRAGI